MLILSQFTGLFGNGLNPFTFGGTIGMQAVRTLSKGVSDVSAGLSSVTGAVGHAVQQPFREASHQAQSWFSSTNTWLNRVLGNPLSSTTRKITNWKVSPTTHSPTAKANWDLWESQGLVSHEGGQRVLKKRVIMQQSMKPIIYNPKNWQSTRQIGVTRQQMGSQTAQPRTQAVLTTGTQQPVTSTVPVIVQRKRGFATV